MVTAKENPRTEAKGQEDASPEEQVLDSRAWWLVGVDCLAGDLGEDHLDKVHRMEETGELNTKGNISGEEHEVAVDEVKHAVRGVDLGGELTKHNGSQDHGKTSTKEDLSHSVAKTKDGSILNSSTAHVDEEDNENDKELTSDNEALHVVSLVGEDGVLVRDLVRILVQVLVNRLETDETSLSTLHHGEPDDEEPEDEEGSNWVGVLGKFGLLTEDTSHDDDDREDQ